MRTVPSFDPGRSASAPPFRKYALVGPCAAQSNVLMIGCFRSIISGLCSRLINASCGRVSLLAFHSPCMNASICGDSGTDPLPRERFNLDFFSLHRARKYTSSPRHPRGIPAARPASSWASDMTSQRHGQSACPSLPGDRFQELTLTYWRHHITTGGGGTF